MPRRRKVQTTKKDWRWYAHTGLNVFVALSMVLGTVVLFTGGSGAFTQRVVLPTVDNAADYITTPVPTVPGLISTSVPPAAGPTQTPAPTPTVKP